jgi:3-dehydroshikimate dehydratase
MITGLASVTFRKLAPREVINLVQLAGLESIEWSGDIHLPCGKVTLAGDIGRMTRESGLKNICYGSHYRLGESRKAGLSFSAVLETAIALGAPSLRIWAGGKSSAEAPLVYRENIIRESRAIAIEAAKARMEVCYEFQAGTLADTLVSTQSLLRMAAQANLKMIWQPTSGLDSLQAAMGLEQLLPQVHHLHVFQPGLADGERKPLAAGADHWKKYLQALARGKGDLPLMLESVLHDSPEQFLEDAETLKSWLD